MTKTRFLSEAIEPTEYPLTVRLPNSRKTSHCRRWSFPPTNLDAGREPPPCDPPPCHPSAWHKEPPFGLRGVAAHPSFVSLDTPSEFAFTLDNIHSTVHYRMTSIMHRPAFATVLTPAALSAPTGQRERLRVSPRLYTPTSPGAGRNSRPCDAPSRKALQIKPHATPTHSVRRCRIQPTKAMPTLPRSKAPGAGTVGLITYASPTSRMWKAHSPVRGSSLSQVPLK